MNHISNKQLTMVVGSYTSQGDDTGLHSFRLNPATGQVQPLHSAVARNASFLTIAPNGRHLWAVSENGPDDSLVSTFSLDASSGEMRPVGSVNACGWSPCHIVQIGSNVAVANYGSGNLALCAIGADGLLKTCHQLIKSHTKDDKPSRMHFTQPLPGRMVAVSNLGLDCLILMRVTSAAPLHLKPVVTVQLPEGCGPRHMALNADGTMLYLVTEKSCEVMAFSYCSTTGSLTLRQTLMASQAQGAAGADLHLSPDGRHLYASMRLKADGIAIFSIGTDGLLSPAGYQPTGTHPRNFAITPCGSLMAVACHDSNSIELYHLDPDTGMPTHLPGLDITVSRPVCIRWVP